MSSERARTAPATAPFLLNVETIDGARCATGEAEDGPFRLGVRAIECGSAEHWVIVLRDYIGQAEVMKEIQEFAGDLEQLRKHVERLVDVWELEPSIVFTNPKVRA